MLYQWLGEYPTVHIPIKGQNHCWSGHPNSGPDSSKPANMQMDATVIIAHFLKIDYSHYTPTIPTNVQNIVTYSMN